MTAAGDGGPDPELYQLLGVAREASPEEIAQAWRRRARAEHPDARPRDAGAPGRFRVLAEAYQVLSDPARRAAYDRALESRAYQPDPDPGVRVRPPRPARPDLRSPGPPLWAGPVRVEGPQAASDRDEAQIRLAALAWWYLTTERDRPW